MLSHYKLTPDEDTPLYRTLHQVLKGSTIEGFHCISMETAMYTFLRRIYQNLKCPKRGALTSGISFKRGSTVYPYPTTCIP